MERIDPLRAIAAALSENEEEETWVDMLTVDALFSALLQFARTHSEVFLPSFFPSFLSSFLPFFLSFFLSFLSFLSFFSFFSFFSFQ